MSSVPNTTTPETERPNQAPDAATRSTPVALEANVSVTGTRANAAARELFTEETTTVLVFRDGAVIRLSAPVVPGQLLFLTDKQNNAEIVCQVLHTRPCNETSTYVNLQFTEPRPNFWDVPFPDTKSSQEFTVKAHLAAEALTTGAPAAPVEPHKAEDVDQLRKEVEALRKQLAELQNQSAAASAPTPSEFPVPGSAPSGEPSTPTPVELLPNHAIPTNSDEAQRAPWMQALLTPATAAPPPEAPLMPAADESEKQQPPRAVIGMSLPIRVAGQGESTNEPAGHVNNAVQGGAADSPELPTPSLDFSQMPSSPYVPTGYGLLRRPSTWTPQRLIALGVFLLATLTVSLWVGKPWRYFGSTKKSAPLSAPSATENPVAAAPAPAPAAAPETSAKAAAKPHDAKGTAKSAADGAAASPDDNASDASESSAADAQASKKRVAAAAAKARTKVTAPESTSAAASASVADEPIVPPKLLKAANPVYPPDAMLNFVTGDVRAEASVGIDGQVTEVRILSGPKAFYDAAIDALKHYEYVPATQGGKPVPSKVTVTVKFWFDP